MILRKPTGIDRREYDEAENALHSIVRIAFTAGWNSAGDDPPTPHKIFEIIPGKEKTDGTDKPE